MRWYSSATGSLTLRIRSPVSHTSSAVASVFAPPLMKSSSIIDDPTPAPASMNTSCPPRTSSCTPAGVIATRYSLFLLSRGIPTFILCSSRAALLLGFWRIHRPQAGEVTMTRIHGQYAHDRHAIMQVTGQNLLPRLLQRQPGPYQLGFLILQNELLIPYF